MSKLLFESIASKSEFYKPKGFSGSSYVFYLRQRFLNSPENTLIVFDHEDQARALVSDLREVMDNDRICFFPQYDRLEAELLPPSPITVFERIVCLKRLVESRKAVILVCSKEALEQKTIPRDRFRDLSVGLEQGQEYTLEKLQRKLVQLGYRREEMVASRGEFAVRGDILDIFPSTEEVPIRCEFFGDELESIRSFDLYTQRSIQDLKALKIYLVQEFDVLNYKLVGDLPEEIKTFFESRDESLEIDRLWNTGFSGLEWLNPYVQSSASLESYAMHWAKPTRIFKDFTVDGVSYFGKNLELFIETMKRMVEDDIEVHLCLPKAGFAKRIQQILKQKNVPLLKGSTLANCKGKPGVMLSNTAVQKGFEIQNSKFCLLTYSDFTGVPFQDTSKKKRGRNTARIGAEGDVLHHFSELKQDDYVVHTDYGVARFAGIENILIDGIKKEFLVLHFDGSDKVFVPITEVDRIHRFSPQEGKTPKLNRLNSVRWGQVKHKAKEDVQKFARELLQQYARREISTGFKYSSDGEKMEEMEGSFEHQETRDQLGAIGDIKRDMQSQIAMDRLLCGDVGFGKTEVAIRASFKAVQDQKQVAVLCPTTILAQQHFQTFQSRLLGYPVKIEVLNRFVSAKKVKEIKEKLKSGKLDIVIGTHRLFSKDIQFQDLGLLVVDEEQRFGVSHKEKLRRLKVGVDTLTLSATPIPRTLQMSLGGARAISVIHTPPPGRLPIKTFVLPYQETTVRQAIERELRRNGQVFYVYNRVVDIEAVGAKLERIIPGLKIRILHGQMDSKQIEEIMGSFLRREFDVLLATTIIESGMDIPNVNTILVERADAFGLAQLYQLRGRIGRRDLQGYAYLFHRDNSSVTDTARKRLAALEEFTDLGSGFKIAMRDLEIRGAGNILGKQQSGFMYSIGFDLYARLLRDAIEKLRNENYREEWEMPQMELRVSSFLDEKYIPSYRDRMDFFRRVSNIKNLDQLEDLKLELFDRYGGFTANMHELFRLVQLRIQGYWCGVKRFQQVAGGIRMEFHHEVESDVLKGLQQSFGSSLSHNPRFKDRLSIDTGNLAGVKLLEFLENFFNDENIRDLLDARS